MIKRNSILAISLVGIFLSLSVWALKDPTKPPPSILAEHYKNNKPDAVLVLNAVIHSDKRKIAVINGNIMKIGDKIAGRELIAIEKTQVQLKRGESVDTLTLIK